MGSTFTITITNPGKTGDSAGFIDSQRVEKYGGTLPTKDQARDKVRGVIRYSNILGLLGTVTTADMISAVFVGGSATTEPSTVSLNMKFRDETALVREVDGVKYEGAEAIRAIMAEGMAIDREATSDYYDPEKFFEIAKFQVGALGTFQECLALVTVA